MSQTLKGKTVAILVTDGFEQVELTGPREALEEAGAKVRILSDSTDKVRGWNHDKPADNFKVDGTSRPPASMTMTRCCCPAA